MEKYGVDKSSEMEKTAKKKEEEKQDKKPNDKKGEEGVKMSDKEIINNLRNRSRDASVRL